MQRPALLRDSRDRARDPSCTTASLRMVLQTMLLGVLQPRLPPCTFDEPETSFETDLPPSRPLFLVASTKSDRRPPQTTPRANPENGKLHR